MTRRRRAPNRKSTRLRTSARFLRSHPNRLQCPPPPMLTTSSMEKDTKLAPDAVAAHLAALGPRSFSARLPSTTQRANVGARSPPDFLLLGCRGGARPRPTRRSPALSCSSSSRWHPPYGCSSSASLKPAAAGVAWGLVGRRRASAEDSEGTESLCTEPSRLPIWSRRASFTVAAR